ncbi:protein shifted-like isoform X3 [Amphibalanus amphitrite]|uniref:protein shifted-like isoform X3 n=1 Tax=Amphibalanus amphitrite TaxID=1232801 RepID=UPI001C90FCDE|nr:protein shifted-like isoform X3 [Amphibalanus amphitrite]
MELTGCWLALTLLLVPGLGQVGSQEDVGPGRPAATTSALSLPARRDANATALRTVSGSPVSPEPPSSTSSRSEPSDPGSSTARRSATSGRPRGQRGQRRQRGRRQRGQRRRGQRRRGPGGSRGPSRPLGGDSSGSSDSPGSSSSSDPSTSSDSSDSTAADSPSAPAAADSSGAAGDTTGRGRQGRRRPGGSDRGRRHRGEHSDDLGLWIDPDQIEQFSGYRIQIPIIIKGQLLSHIMDPNFERYLPMIPAEVGYVNFTWSSGRRRYNYSFYELASDDTTVLMPPIVSINRSGRVPKKARMFSIVLPCVGNVSGVVFFTVGLDVMTRRRGRRVRGMPLRLRLKKECRISHGPDPECDKRCGNGGFCSADGQCQCPLGYMGKYCNMALCYPQCMNGGTCVKPGKCECQLGYQGPHCEGGICHERCLNGGKCIQKDTCHCKRGYYGPRCQYSKCLVPCQNGGRCRGVNRCRCRSGYSGDHCEVVARQPCRRCRHGQCVGSRCECDRGWFGRRCNKRKRGRKGRWRKGRRRHRPRTRS